MKSDDLDDPRRGFLVNALSIGAFSATASAGLLQSLWAMGKIPEKLVPGQSIYDIKGTVLVDGKPATIKTKIGPNSHIKTGRKSHLIFAVEKDAFILRSNSDLKLGSTGLVIQGMRMLSGKLLSVFGKRAKPFKVQTTTATIGIRGTGVYLEADPEETYICTCYGKTTLSSNNDPNVSEDIVARHHDAPRYITNANSGKIIRPAPFINHTDAELALIEELVGRTTPFSFAGGGYDAPRKKTY